MNSNEHVYQCTENDNVVIIDAAEGEIRVANCAKKDWLIVGFADLRAAFAAAACRCFIAPRREGQSDDWWAEMEQHYRSEESQGWMNAPMGADGSKKAGWGDMLGILKDGETEPRD
jgi:hypothetical protein